ncbi:hypothetical protein [Photobacterium galatheae]|uniref:Uncharacterized protein n=1 Tax=Photobacterium galatheae TaxID=1654360 RepID=A0A066RT74_9GAMM|nr:hypothetical protein [Photobacterium galatheae]KDM92296.1 hypothetical protein EA58_07335 [Photobacterium galatheae]MCM0150523.1 hypothetical protein [Photobacterium galatheae]
MSRPHVVCLFLMILSMTVTRRTIGLKHRVRMASNDTGAKNQSGIAGFPTEIVQRAALIEAEEQ